MACRKPVGVALKTYIFPAAIAQHTVGRRWFSASVHGAVAKVYPNRKGEQIGFAQNDRRHEKSHCVHHVRDGQLPVKIEHISSLCLNGIHQTNHFIFTD